MSKVLGILVKILAFFYNAHSPNMVMSRDPRSKFRKTFICPNSRFNIRKSHNITSVKALYFKSCQQKTPPVPSGLRYS